MKKCVACQKDIPDGAIHCVFCGAKQQASGLNPMPSAGANQQKTIMGYAAADLAKFGIPMPGEPTPPLLHAPPPAAPPPAGFGRHPRPRRLIRRPPPRAAPQYAPAARRRASSSDARRLPPPRPRSRHRHVRGWPRAAPLAGPPWFRWPRDPGAAHVDDVGEHGWSAPAGAAAWCPPLQVQSPQRPVTGSSHAGVSRSASQPRMAAQSRPPSSPAMRGRAVGRFVPPLDGPRRARLIATTVAPWQPVTASSSSLGTSHRRGSRSLQDLAIVYGASGSSALLLGLIPVPVGVRGIAGVVARGCGGRPRLCRRATPVCRWRWRRGGGMAGVRRARRHDPRAGRLISRVSTRTRCSVGSSPSSAVRCSSSLVIPDGSGLPIVNFFKSLGGGGGLRLATVWFAAFTLLPGLFALLCIAKPIIASFWRGCHPWTVHRAPHRDGGRPAANGNSQGL